MRFSTVLFDFDGTLFDTSPGILRCMRAALEKNGYDAHTDEWLKRFIGPPILPALKEFYGMEEAQAEKVKTDYRTLYRAEGVFECSPMPGAKECLLALRAAGVQIAVATSKPYYFAEDILKRYDFYPLFDAVCGARSDEHSAKAEIVADALSALRAPLGRTVMVGDRKYDVLGAKECGIPCIGLDSGFAEEDEFERAGAISVVQTFQQLTRLLLG